jgi:hypothetical protein
VANAYFYSNIAQATTLAGSISSGATSISVAATTGFPGSFPYVLALDFEGATEELVVVTAAAGTTLTVTRGHSGTSAQSHSLGAAVRHVFHAGDATDFRTHEAATSGVHGVTGDLVGATMTQTLTNKTLTSPTINNATYQNGGSLGGTFSGTPTLSGAVVFSGAPSFTGNPVFQGGAAATVASSHRVSGDSTPRLQVRADGQLQWGPGNAAADTILYREAASILGTEDALRFTRSATGDDVLQTRVSGDAGIRYLLEASGVMAWGDGTSFSMDTNLYRSSANLLKTDDSLEVAQNLTVTGNTAVTGNLTVTGVGQVRVVEKTADEPVTSSTTLQNDNDLVVSVVANAKYEIVLYAAINGAASGDVKLAWTVPASATGQRYSTGPAVSSATSTADTTVRASSVTDSFTTEINYGVFSVGQQSFIQETLYITTAGTAGNVQLQWAQNASSGTATTVEAGSYMKVTRVA